MEINVDQASQQSSRVRIMKLEYTNAVPVQKEKEIRIAPKHILLKEQLSLIKPVIKKHDWSILHPTVVSETEREHRRSQPVLV